MLLHCQIPYVLKLLNFNTLYFISHVGNLPEAYIVLTCFSDVVHIVNHIMLLCGPRCPRCCHFFSLSDIACNPIQRHWFLGQFQNLHLIFFICVRMALFCSCTAIFLLGQTLINSDILLLSGTLNRAGRPTCRYLAPLGCVTLNRNAGFSSVRTVTMPFILLSFRCALNECFECSIWHGLHKFVWCLKTLISISKSDYHNPLC